MKTSFGSIALPIGNSAAPSALPAELSAPFNHGNLASIPRVIMTAANDQMIGVREDVTVLYKPVDFDALTRLLQRYCEPAESARIQ